jgi:hypothetical protein
LFAAIVELKVPKRKHPSLHVLIGILVQLMCGGISFDFFFSSPSMESPKRKRISDIKAGVLMIDQVKPAVLEGTAVRFDLSKGKVRFSENIADLVHYPILLKTTP